MDRRPAPLPRFARPPELLARGGRPLEEPVRRYMESRFGRDLSQVRVHTGARAGAAARAIGVRAFAAGDAVAFAEGQYSPRTHEGRWLLAHELAHVVQQRGGGPAPVLAFASSAAEREADDAARQVMRGGAPPLIAARPFAVARSGDERAGRNASLDARIARIDELLSYGVFDWAITDAEAVEAFRILRAMTNEERVVALARIDVGRLSENLPQRQQPEFAVMLVAGARTERLIALLQRLLSTDFFSFNWSISAEDVSNVMLILRTLPDADRDRVMRAIGRESRRGLWGAASPDIRAELDRYWQEMEQRTVDSQRREIAERERQRRPPEDPVAVKRRHFIQWIQFTSPRDPFSVEVNIRYLNWVEQHTADPEFLTLEPHDLYSRMAAEVQERFIAAQTAMHRARERGRAAAAATQRDMERFNEFQRFIQERLRFISQTNATEARVQSEILRRFIEWVAANQHTREYRRSTPLQIYERIGRGVITPEVDVERMRAARAPQTDEARRRQFDAFHALAMRLLEYRRRFPYVIPVPSEGVDILVQGDPAQQAVFDTMARELISWSVQHYNDADYTTQPPAAVLSAIVTAHREELRAASLQPLVFERIARTDIDPERVAASFVTTLGKVLLASAIVGIVVGAEVLTLGQVTWILVAVGAAMGAQSYRSRRQEISATGIDVPRAETVLASAGDIIGLSQLIEGSTGLQLGTGRRMNTVERSEALGEGAGSVAGFFAGTRAFQSGRAAGAGLRTARIRPGATATAGQTPAATGGVTAAETPRPLTLPGPAEHFPFGSGQNPPPQPSSPNRLYRIMGLGEAAEALRTGRLPPRIPGAEEPKFLSLDATYTLLFRERLLAEVETMGRRMPALEQKLTRQRARLAAAEAQGDTATADAVRPIIDDLSRRMGDNRARMQQMIEQWYWAQGQSVMVEIELVPGATDHMLNRAVTPNVFRQYGGQDIYVWKFERGYGPNLGIPDWNMANFNELVVGIRFYAERGTNLFGTRTLPPGNN